MFGISEIKKEYKTKFKKIKKEEKVFWKEDNFDLKTVSVVSGL